MKVEATDGVNPAGTAMAAPETGLVATSLPPWVVPTLAEAAPAKMGVIDTLVEP